VSERKELRVAVTTQRMQTALAVVEVLRILDRLPNFVSKQVLRIIDGMDQ
jgi:hypothetical protein